MLRHCYNIIIIIFLFKCSNNVLADRTL